MNCQSMMGRAFFSDLSACTVTLLLDKSERYGCCEYEAGLMTPKKQCSSGVCR
jgi:hypothetical protein